LTRRFAFECRGICGAVSRSRDAIGFAALPKLRQEGAAGEVTANQRLRHAAIARSKYPPLRPRDIPHRAPIPSFQNNAPSIAGKRDARLRAIDSPAFRHLYFAARGIRIPDCRAHYWSFK